MWLIDDLLNHRSRRQLELEQLRVQRWIELLLVEAEVQHGKVLIRHPEAPDLGLRRYLELDLGKNQVGLLGVGGDPGIVTLRPRLEVLEILLEMQPAEQER